MSARLHVGLDFGTSNSLLCHYDRADGPIPFIPDGGDAFGVPTVVELNVPLSQRRFGNRARDLETAARYIKLILGNWRKKTGEDAHYRDMKDYLEFLFDAFRVSMGKTPIQNLVITVPEIWHTEQYPGGKEALGKAVRDLGLIQDSSNLSAPGLPVFLSEPVAAACYFAWRCQRAMRKPFSGYVLVYDHGGGTLDLSLCRVDGLHVERVAGHERSADTKQGFGGDAFDMRVLEALRANGGMRGGPNKKADPLWLSRFEQAKRYTAPHIASRYRKRFQDQRAQRVFEVDGVDVKLGVLADSFDRWFSQEIEQTLTAFMAECRRVCPDLRLNDPSQFRILMVGGFSAFHPVRRRLEQVFLDQGASPEVFDTDLDEEERCQAIARGACLFAAGVITLEQKPPFTFGLIYYEGDDEKREPLILKEVALSEYREAKLSALDFGVRQMRARTRKRSLSFYREIGGEPVPLTMKQPLEDVLPAYDENDRQQRWRFGCCVKGGVVQLVIKPAKGQARSYEIGRFFDLRQGRIGGDL